MNRQVSYRWRLRELMAAHNMFATVDLLPLLAQRGISLSASQVHRLVTGTPERLSLPVLAALCDIFGCTATDLIPTAAESIARRRAAGSAELTVVDPAAITPKRARLRPAP
ncbi:MAG: helix-turn-helix transcriptional regulator [Actinomycetota bacterium]|nr:helix-turn-helix transcriptional regulator [Actinomycetota bacterium]